MTILVALTDGDRTVIGSDSAIFNGNTKRDFGCSKFVHWTASGWRVGVSASLRLVTFAHSQLSPTRSWDAYGLAEALRKFVVADEWKKREDDGDPWRADAGVIIAKPGEVWEISSDFSVLQMQSGMLACAGAGWETAASAGYAMKVTGHADEAVVRVAVETAISRSVWCGGSAFVEVVK